jgi:predicted methyltransferase
MRPLIALALAATVLAGPAVAETAHAPGDYAAALADPTRPEADRARDADRKPAELLAFAEIDPGEKVGDFFMGGGYLTHILAGAVGSEGKVYGFQPAEFIGFRAAYGTEQDAVAAAHANVVPLRAPFAEPNFPEKLDTIVAIMTLHDLFIPQMPEGTGAKGIAALYAALKPGGTLIVVDHKAREGSGTTTTGAMHRIDEQTAIEALTAAGFVLEAESDLYARPDDPRDKNVFDPAIRGKTDQFTLRLRKPA